MMNPFAITIRDSLLDGKVNSKYDIKCFIRFYRNCRTPFSFPGKTIYFDGDIGVALEPLGIGKPFWLKSSWADVWNYR